MNTEIAGEPGAQASVQAHNHEHQGTAEQLQLGHLSAKALAPDEALVATPDGHGDDHQQDLDASDDMPGQGVNGGLAEDAADVW